MFIKPITIRIVAYGQKANLAAIRTRAVKLLEEEHGDADPAACVETSSQAAHDEIAKARRDSESPLRKPTPAQAGIIITLREVNERMTTEWLRELPVAKTCVAFAIWDSPREKLAWQMLLTDGDRWTDSVPLAT